MDQDKDPPHAGAFEAWIDEVLKPRAHDQLIRPEVFRRATAELPFLAEVLERQASQKEFRLPIWDYLAIAASEERIRNGRQALRRHRALFNAIERAFGVEPEVVAAIWGLETGYGVVMGDVPVLPALATLAFAGRRAASFEAELIAALRLVQLGRLAPERMRGSWAGAMGHGQFMPSALLDFGIDLDGDGRCDITGEDPTDALASVANYLKKHGWRAGQPWGFEVRLPEGFDHARAGLDQSLSMPEWARLGVTTADGDRLPDYGAGSILLPAGARGVALLTTGNFQVLLRYNQAVSYGVGVGHLSDRLAGGRPFAAAWPEDERDLSALDVTEAQALLTRAGFDTFGVDGMTGPNTTRAVRAYQLARGLVADGHLGPDLLDRLRRDAG